jgi:hypothetical protein
MKINEIMAINIKRKIGGSKKQKTPPEAGFFKKVSGWQDSNLRPPGPKPGAITGLRYIPN